MRSGALSFVIIVSVLLPFLAVHHDIAVAVSQTVVISRLQLGGNGSGTASQEYIEITNRGLDDIDVTGWCLYYASSSASTIGTKLHCLSTDSVEQRLMLPSYGSISFATTEFKQAHPEAIHSILFTAGMSGTGGHLRIVHNQATIDSVGWGTAAYAEGEPAALPQPGQLLQRRLIDVTLVDTDNNIQDFVSAPLTAVSGVDVYEAVDYCLNNEIFPGLQAAVPDGIVTDASGVCTAAPEPTLCDSILISEILPNPAGDDTGQEYVELFNASIDEAADLSSCQLHVNNVPVALNRIVEPQQYQVILGVSLPNATGGIVTLLGSNVQTVTYPGELRDDEAYALIDGKWLTTNRPSPGEVNVSSISPTSSGSNSQTKLAPCPVGKERNPATNRCRTISTGQKLLTPCDAGQYRSPETNRCRSLAQSSGLKACAPNQIRNPETNRCRNIAAAASLLKPCDEGEERNPETNRCRKIAAVAGSTTEKQNNTPQSSTNYRVLLIALVLALGYAIYEYRQDISRAAR